MFVRLDKIVLEAVCTPICPSPAPVTCIGVPEGCPCRGGGICESGTCSFPCPGGSGDCANNPITPTALCCRETGQGFLCKSGSGQCLCDETSLIVRVPQATTTSVARSTSPLGGSAAMSPRTFLDLRPQPASLPSAPRPPATSSAAASRTTAAAIRWIAASAANRRTSASTPIAAPSMTVVTVRSNARRAARRSIAPRSGPAEPGCPTIAVV